MFINIFLSSESLSLCIFLSLCIVFYLLTFLCDINSLFQKHIGKMEVKLANFSFLDNSKFMQIVNVSLVNSLDTFT